MTLWGGARQSSGAGFEPLWHAEERTPAVGCRCSPEDSVSAGHTAILKEITQKELHWV